MHTRYRNYAHIYERQWNNPNRHFDTPYPLDGGSATENRLMNALPSAHAHHHKLL